MAYYGVRKLCVMKIKERERESTTILRQKRYGKKVQFLHLTLSANAFSKGKASPTPLPFTLKFQLSPISSSNLGLSSTQILLPNSNAFLGFFQYPLIVGSLFYLDFANQFPNPCWDSSSIHRFETLNNGFDGEEMPI